MPELRIPKEHRKGLLKLGSLTEEQQQELLSLLRDTRPGKTKQLMDAIAAKAKTIDAKDLKGILSTLVALNVVREFLAVPIADFARDVLASLRKDDEDASDGEGRTKLLETLASALDVKPFALSAKAQSLAREHQNLFHEAKIFTDLRPVFDFPTDPPVGVIIEYALKLAFHRGPTHEELYMALDADDVGKIKAVVERAQAKAASLKLFLSDKGVSELG